MDAVSAIKNRRSVRQYLKKPVSKKDLEKILSAGKWAPSGLNNQPWKYKIFEDELKDELAKHTRYGKVIRAAPVCIAVFFDREDSYDRDKDMQSIGASIQNMLVAIHSLGLGGVWLGEIKNQGKEVQKELGIKYELMAVIALGHPTPGVHGDKDRKQLKDLLI
jgi:nitroreductase